MDQFNYDHAGPDIDGEPASSRSPGGGDEPPPALGPAPEAPPERGFFMPDTTPKSDLRLLRPIEVAAILGIGRSKTYELLDAGVLPCCVIGRSKRTPLRKLEQWIEAHTTGGAVHISDGAQS